MLHRTAVHRDVALTPRGRKLSREVLDRGDVDAADRGVLFQRSFTHSLDVELERRLARDPVDDCLAWQQVGGVHGVVHGRGAARPGDEVAARAARYTGLVGPQEGQRMAADDSHQQRRVGNVQFAGRIRGAVVRPLQKAGVVKAAVDDVAAHRQRKRGVRARLDRHEPADRRSAGALSGLRQTAMPIHQPVDLTVRPARGRRPRGRRTRTGFPGNTAGRGCP